ncbi:hypothetical protein [Mangrovibacterium lignilyticum]|uniref:hypothetical protein n=1 Tax=Mangrovibacterium lignilyticum TaxID=2668052 RepID=UPI0013D5C26E|nr:hypothetical protein [Mangrovibacterium lignilyticum]
MKKILLLAALIISVVVVSAQSTYKYVIIPIVVPEIGNGIDPSGVSSSLQKALSKKSIECVFESAERPADYCEALTAVIEKESSLLRNKISIKLRDCMNRVVWENAGVGMSKEFREGYAEAIEDALKDFNELPAIKYAQSQVATTVPVAAAVVPATVTPELPVVEATEQVSDYTPQNIYFNEKYLVDYVSTASGDRKLIILNGNSLGYEKMQDIATLVSSDLQGIYTVKFMQPNGDVWTGVANETSSELKISISRGDDRTVITLQKQ